MHGGHLPQETGLSGIVISLIYLYQRHASARLRNSCRFEPSCSNYMILAIEKHGTWSGVLMGIRRILRCAPPNGGEDFP